MHSPADALGGDSQGTGRKDAATPKTPVDLDRVEGSQERLSAGSSSDLGAQRPRTPSRSPSQARGEPESSAGASSSGTAS